MTPPDEPAAKAAPTGAVHINTAASTDADADTASLEPDAAEPGGGTGAGAEPDVATPQAAASGDAQDAAGRDAEGQDAAGRDTAGQDAAGRETAGPDAVEPGPSARKEARAIRAPGRRSLAWAAVWTAAAVLLGVSGWVYADTRGDGTLSYGKARDAALDAGRADIVRVTSVERGHVDRDLAAWLDVTSGPLHDQLSRSRTSDAGRLKAADTTAGGDVTDAAVTELDTRAGTARLIATVSVRTTAASGAATSDRKRFEAALSRTAGTWKLTALTAVPLGAS